MRLTVALTSTASCNVGLNKADADVLFRGQGKYQHFCRVLRLSPSSSVAAGRSERYVGWTGGVALGVGTLEISHIFAECLGLQDGQTVDVDAVAEPEVVNIVTVQPANVDDWEVVELQAAYIEENLLSQVAVLSPGLVFPVWIHAQAPVRLQVDSSDQNIGACFLLSVDTELSVAPKPRKIGGTSMRVWTPAQEVSLDCRLSLRVQRLAPDMDVPSARLNYLDLAALLGQEEISSTTVWLQWRGKSSSSSSTAGAAEGGSSHADDEIDVDGKSSDIGSSQLLRVDGSGDVPRQHIILAACVAEKTFVPRFAFVEIWRCRHVPVFVPHLQLVPLQPVPRWAGVSEEAWVLSAFRKLVESRREICVINGSIVQLRGERLSEKRPAESERRGEGHTNGFFRPFASPPAASSRAAGAAQHMTDIRGAVEATSDDLDASPTGHARGVALNEWEVVGEDEGIVEIDLGCDDDWFSDHEGPVGALPGPGAVQNELQIVIPVRVNFMLSDARLASVDASAPPFARVTTRALDEDIEVSVVRSCEKQADSAPQAFLAGASAQDASKRRRDRSAEAEAVDHGCVALRQLWMATPGLPSMPEASWAEVISLIQPPPSSPATASGQAGEGEGVGASSGRASLDSIDLFEDAALELRKMLVAQLGCRVPDRVINDSERAGAAAGVPNGTRSKVPEEQIEYLSGPTSLPTLAEEAARVQDHPWAVPGLTAVIGAPGTGKSRLCRRVCAELREDSIMAIEVACPKLGQPSRKFKVIQQWLRSVLQFASWHSPSIVVLDDMGALFPDVEQGSPNMSITEERSSVLAEQFMDLLVQLRACGARVAVVASMPSDAAVHRLLWRALVLEHKVTLRSPELKERPLILQKICESKMHDGWQVDEALLQEGSLDDWSGRLDGFSIADLCGLVEKACTESVAKAGGSLRQLQFEELEVACESFVPATMADQSFFTSEVRWSDIGGLEAAKQALLGMLTTPTKYAVLVDRAPVRPRKGIILVGPPGCGKTYLVHAAAHETKGLLRFLTVKGPELLSKYIGASEAGVRQVFERAAAAAPSAIFFDEIDSLAPKRGADSTGVTDRVVNQMLCYLDGVDERGRVYVIAATSRPDMVDAALMRPGRFDQICYCGLPSLEEKLEICDILAAKHGLTADVGEESSPESLQNELKACVSALPRLFTSADLNAWFSSAKIASVNEALEKRPSASKDPVQPVLRVAHLRTAMASAKASISAADKARYDHIFAPYVPGGGGKAGAARTAPDAPQKGRVALA